MPSAELGIGKRELVPSAWCLVPSVGNNPDNIRQLHLHRGLTRPRPPDHGEPPSRRLLNDVAAASRLRAWALSVPLVRGALRALRFARALDRFAVCAASLRKASFSSAHFTSGG